jgi:hypothetical protein
MLLLPVKVITEPPWNVVVFATAFAPLKSLEAEIVALATLILNAPVPKALLLPKTSVVFAVSIELPPLKVFAPFNLMVPPPVKLSATVFVLDTIPFTINVPPLAWSKVCVPEAAPSTMGASIVFVPLVIADSIALVVPVPVLVRVSLMPVFELVRSYPEDEVVEKFNC